MRKQRPGLSPGSCFVLRSELTAELEEVYVRTYEQLAAKSQTAEATDRRTGPPEGKFSAEELKDPDSITIKEQIARSRELLNRMDVVASVTAPTDLYSTKETLKWVTDALRQTGYAVDCQGFGRIRYLPADISKALRYADTPEERAALAALPKVLKNGAEIWSSPKHKQRTKSTVTFAGPVELNGVRGNMAVVVNRHGNTYYAHRIVLPDGTTFIFADKKIDATQELSRGVTNTGSLAKTTSVASEEILAESEAEVKGNFSREEDQNFLRELQPDGTARWTQDRINSLLEEYGSTAENYSKAYATFISPEDFLSLTTTHPERIEAESRELNEQELASVRQPIYLVCDPDHPGIVYGHEGRHRMVALRNAGVKQVPIVVEMAGETGKFNRQPMDSLHVTGQEFSNGTAPGAVTLTDLVPISRAHRTELAEKFGGTGQVNFSQEENPEYIQSLEELKQENGRLQERVQYWYKQAHLSDASKPVDAAVTEKLAQAFARVLFCPRRCGTMPLA